MLRTIEVICPFCEAAIRISVATPESDGMKGSLSSCRACRHRIMTMTLPDGLVGYIDDDKLYPLRIVGEQPATPSQSAARDRHKVLPPQNLGLFDRGGAVPRPKGVSDWDLEHKAASLSDALWRPDGTRRAPAEAARHIGWRSVWITQLRENILARLSKPPPFSEPPSIFLSYRWGDDQHNGWLASLAETLSARGYRVTLDRLVPPEQMVVPSFVSSLADCRYFLAVIDPGYVERLGTDKDSDIKDGWVFDEVRNAFALENQGLLRVVGLLREGVQLPVNFNFPATGRPGNTIDVRDPELLASFVDDVFPDREAAANAARWQAAEALYGASLEALSAGDHQAAFDRATELVEAAPALIDGYVQQVRVCLAAGAVEAGLTVVTAACDRFPEQAELDLAAAQFALELGQSKLAVHHAARVLAADKVPDERRAKAHSILGTAIDDFGQVDVAIAHLGRAMLHFGRHPMLLQNLGFMQRRADQPAAAAALFAEALEADPGSMELRTNLVASLIEAGEPGLARRDLAKIRDARIVAALGEKIDELEAGGGPVVLIERPPPRVGALRATCASCNSSLIVPDRSGLCIACGSPRPLGPEPCDFCDEVGRVPLMADGPDCVCPFCRQGPLRVERLAASA